MKYVYMYVQNEIVEVDKTKWEGEVEGMNELGERNAELE